MRDESRRQKAKIKRAILVNAETQRLNDEGTVNWNREEHEGHKDRFRALRVLRG